MATKFEIETNDESDAETNRIVAAASIENVREIVVTNVSRETVLHTNESRLYTAIGQEFAAHDTVKHSAKEYVRGTVHTNTIEGYFSIFKRGTKAVYRHCAKKHLYRYLLKFYFRLLSYLKLERFIPETPKSIQSPQNRFF